MKFFTSLFAGFLFLFFLCSPCLAGPPEAAYAYALAQAQARAKNDLIILTTKEGQPYASTKDWHPAKGPKAPEMAADTTLQGVVNAIAAMEAPADATALSTKLDALAAKVDKLGMAGCTCNCGCPNCKCPLSPSGRTAISGVQPNYQCPSCGCGLLLTSDVSGKRVLLKTETKTDVSASTAVCSIIGYDGFGKAIYSCPPGAVCPPATSTVSYSSPVTYTYSSPIYSSGWTNGATVWSDGTVTYDAPAGRARRCGPIRRALGLCQ